MQTSSPAGVRRPRIGLPVRLSSPTDPDPDPRVAEANSLFDYIVDLVRDGGGEPVLLTPELLGGGPHDGGPRAVAPEALDGVVLPGGGDLDPRLYGEEPGSSCYDINLDQDRLDIAVAQ